MADDGGVGEQEQRLGDEGEERGQRQAEDLAVLGHVLGSAHPERVVRVRGRPASDPYATSPARAVDNYLSSVDTTGGRCFVDKPTGIARVTTRGTEPVRN
ncbi:hypothetical protein GCM10012276_20560 [Nocardioides deserti]|nr:hypothetical protein GCM10012276_20560 [Nocardioides deserti]